MSAIVYNEIEIFMSSYMSTPLPDWLLPFEGSDTNMTKTVRDNGFSIVKDYAVKGWTADNLIPVPYVPGKIACVQIPGAQYAISSQFSGCYMASFCFKDSPADRFVCHIAIGDLYNQENEKLFFECASIQRNVDFEPHGKITELPEVKQSKAISEYKIGYRDVYGIITKDDDYYSFIIGKKGNNYYIVAWAGWKKDGSLRHVEIVPSSGDS